MALLSPALAAAALALACVVYVVRQLLLLGLRRAPGPWHTLLTGAALRWHEFHGNRTRYVHRLHLRHGPVVRLGPNELAFASAEAAREIYCSGGSGYDKTEFYNLFTVYGRRTMFSTLNKEDHARKKRILADRYANSNVMRQPALAGIQQCARNFADLCGASVGKSLDIYVTLHSYAFDCVTHHLFHPFGASSLRSKADEEVMREVTFDDSLQNRLLKHHSPTLHALAGRAVAALAGARPRETPLADRFVLETTARAKASPFTLLSRMHDRKKAAADGEAARGGGGLEQVDIAAECCDHMVAGIDTTGDALCFLMYQLSLPESAALQRRLQAELKGAQQQQQQQQQQPDGGTTTTTATTTTTQFDRLPFLDAVVHEGLRCFPAIPMSLPRYVPAGGRTIDGVFAPAGTVVSCQAYSVHRLNRDVFPRPETFDPDRWLRPEGDAARRRHMFAFSNGGRGCIGKHLALAEMKLLLRDVYSRFSTAPDPCMTPESMAMSDQLISSRPAGQRCLLRFIPLEDHA
ncbi:hypothetical protein RB597_004843 [Gaeumannomyces tritici]